MESPVLQIENLSVNFVTDDSKTTAIQTLSLEINKGEIVAVVGESGSGKSVTALSILKLLPSPPAEYASGNINFFEQEDPVDLLKMDNARIQTIRGKRISMIFQEPMASLNPVHTCGQQVMEALMLHENITAKQAKEKTISLFTTVKLPDPANIINRYPHQLSGGQKQRVMIAMAISCNPAILIADEPTTALDVTVQKTILKLIKQIQERSGMSVIYITHDLNLVAGFADKVVVMYKGAIVESGSTRKIFTDAEHPYTKA